MPPKLLLVVFARQEGRPEAAAALAARRVVADWDVEGRDLEVDLLSVPRGYEAAAQAVVARLDATRPDLLLVYDTDPDTEEYKLHQFAANYDDAAAPDAAGEVRVDHIIDEAGPVAYRTRLPFDGVWDKFIVERVPVRMSHKAEHVFNHVFYRAMRHIHESDLQVLGGAIETPPLGDAPHLADAPPSADAHAEAVGPRSLERLEEETIMILAVLRRLYPAALDEE